MNNSCNQTYTNMTSVIRLHTCSLCRLRCRAKMLKHLLLLFRLVKENSSNSGDGNSNKTLRTTYYLYVQLDFFCSFERGNYAVHMHTYCRQRTSSHATLLLKCDNTEKKTQDQRARGNRNSFIRVLAARIQKFKTEIIVKDI